MVISSNDPMTQISRTWYNTCIKCCTMTKSYLIYFCVCVCVYRPSFVPDHSLSDKVAKDHFNYKNKAVVDRIHNLREK